MNGNVITLVLNEYFYVYSAYIYIKVFKLNLSKNLQKTCIFFNLTHATEEVFKHETICTAIKQGYSAGVLPNVVFLTQFNQLPATRLNKQYSTRSIMSVTINQSTMQLPK